MSRWFADDDDSGELCSKSLTPLPAYVVLVYDDDFDGWQFWVAKGTREAAEATADGLRKYAGFDGIAVVEVCSQHIHPTRNHAEKEDRRRSAWEAFRAEREGIQ